MIMETVPLTLHRDPPQSLSVVREPSEWQSHHESAQAVIQHAMDHLPVLKRALVVGVGTGRDLPINITGFEQIYLHDSERANIRAVRNLLTSWGGRGVLNDVLGGMTGISYQLRDYLAAIHEQLTPAALASDLRSLIETPRRVKLLTQYPANLTVSSMVIPRVLDEPLLQFRSQLETKLGKEKFGELAETFDRMIGELKTQLFFEYLLMLSRQTDPLDGVMALNVPMSVRENGITRPVLPAGADRYLGILSARSRKILAGETDFEWTWNYDPLQQYRVKGYILKADQIGEEDRRLLSQ
ncbi:hypothetical protein HY029_01060 [Candidatus Gottesmanbacteria bacterium]|nr:hypothetical protein [Candidatus Gottesmanbacteria bacterium]